MSKNSGPNSIGYRKPVYLSSDDPRAATSNNLESFRSKVGSKVIIKNKISSFMDLDEYSIPVVVYDYWFGSLGASETFGDARSIEIDSSGNVYTLKAVFVVGGPRTMFLTKHDKNANLLWVKKISNASAVAGNTAGLAIDSSNNIYVYANGTVVDTSVTYSIYILIKYDSSGNLLWQKQEQHNTTTGSKTWTDVRSLSIDSSGNVYLIGSRRTTTTRYASLVIKYDSSGTILWQKILVGGDSTSGNQGWYSTVDSSGNVYVITRYTPTITANGIQLLITKINSSGSAITWQKLLTGGTPAPYLPFKAKIDSLNNIYILSYGGTGAGSNMNFLTKYDSAGTRVWVKKISNARADGSSFWYSDFTIDSTDHIYFVGNLSYFSTTNKPTVVKIESTTGAIVWEKLIQQTSPSGSDDLLSRIAIDNVNQKISILGVLNSPTAELTTLILEVPLDTDFTGTYTIPANTYDASSTLSVSTITHTVITDITNTTSSNAATVLTAFSPALTDETASTTDEVFTTYDWSYAGF